MSLAVMLQSADSRCKAAFQLDRGKGDQHGRWLSPGDLEFEASLQLESAREVLEREPVTTDWLPLRPLKTGSNCFSEVAGLSPVGSTESFDQGGGLCEGLLSGIYM